MNNESIVPRVQSTIARIKAMDPGMYLTYSFPDMPDGVFFMYQKDLMPLAERYEAYEKALLKIHSLDHLGRINALTTEVLGDVLSNDKDDIDVEEFD